MTDTPAGLILHATCVAVGARGLLILGGSGRGKSALALQMIALGARLVADDRVRITADPQGLTAACPTPAIQGWIEARGFGLLHLPAQDSARLVLALDLDRAEPDRLPQPHQLDLAGHALPLAYAPPGPHLPAALVLHLSGAARRLDM